MGEVKCDSNPVLWSDNSLRTSQSTSSYCDSSKYGLSFAMLGCAMACALCHPFDSLNDAWTVYAANLEMVNSSGRL